MDIDFSTWTDAQLEAGRRLAPAAIDAELAKRVGTDDGSKARVDALIAQNKRTKK